MIELKYTGMVLRNNQGKLSIFISEPMNGSIFYRGESKDNSSTGGFKASFQRDVIGSAEHCIKYIQKEIFLCWYTQTPYYKYFISKKFMGGDFALDKEAVAQHYGFATNYLDITTNRRIAEFFAYTYYDKNKGVYLPIEEFADTPPCLYTGLDHELMNPYNKDIVIVGFQVLPRPMWQCAMAINLENTKQNYNKLFHKTELPKDKQRARKIYEDFAGGEALFPQDIASIVQRKIETSYCLNKHIFDNYCSIYKIKSNDKKLLKNSIIQKGYSFDEICFIVSKQEQKLMQKEINEIIIPWIDNNIRPPGLVYRPV